MAAKAANPKRERKEKTGEPKIATNTISFQLFKEGKSVAEIAKERNLSTSTIEGHLALYVGSGEIDINKLVPFEKQLLIKGAAKMYGSPSSKVLKENLPEEISYGEIRLVMAAKENSQSMG